MKLNKLTKNELIDLLKIIFTTYLDVIEYEKLSKKWISQNQKENKCLFLKNQNNTNKIKYK